MYGLLVVFHIFVSALLIIAVLIQQTKGTGLSSVFGGGGTEALFGGRGAAPFLMKVTSGLAVAFFITSLLLVITYRSPKVKTATEKIIEEKVPELPTSIQPIVPEETPGPIPGGE
ncbi:MAG TPA: preprotein translocase subunit SecG [bacterium (Candidatus Stahlbacteria)]|nr:preprotein translocase subunit SecG [Candidatus Stahlbacteria bacterium]